MTSEVVAELRNPVNDDEVLAVLEWLQREFEHIEKEATNMKKDRVITAAIKLEELGVQKDTIASMLAKMSDLLGVSRAWLYRIIPRRYKDRKRSEATEIGIAAGGQRLLVDVPHSVDWMPLGVKDPWTMETGQRKFRINEFDVQFRYRELDDLMWAAKTGICNDCNCRNCKKLRQMSLL